MDLLCCIYSLKKDKQTLGIIAINSKVVSFFFRRRTIYRIFFHFLYASLNVFLFHCQYAWSETLKNIFIKKRVQQANECKRMLIVKCFCSFSMKQWGEERIERTNMLIPLKFSRVEDFASLFTYHACFQTQSSVKFHGSNPLLHAHQIQSCAAS